MPMHSTALRITGLAQRLEECVLVQSALDPSLAPRGIGLYARLGIDAVQDTGDSLAQPPQVMFGIWKENIATSWFVDSCEP